MARVTESPTESASSPASDSTELIPRVKDPPGGKTRESASTWRRQSCILKRGGAETTVSVAGPVLHRGRRGVPKAGAGTGAAGASGGVRCSKARVAESSCAVEGRVRPEKEAREIPRVDRSPKTGILLIQIGHVPCVTEIGFVPRSRISRCYQRAHAHHTGRGRSQRRTFP